MIQTAPPTVGLSPAEKRVLLAELLRKKARAAKSVYPLSDNQQGIWFLCQFAPESSIYNVSFAARIRAALDIPAFRRAFQALVDRHPSLRTTFAVHSGKPFQQIHEHRTVHFEEIDASAWRGDELQTRLVEETQRRFDLERGPVMRVSLFTQSAQVHVLLLVIHHIVVDFWSLAVILNELGVLYPAEKAGRPAALPPLDVQYTDFVRWQAEMLASPAGERLWGYWKKQLAGSLPVLNLPTDRPRPPIQMFRGGQYDFTLNEELARRLRALAKSEGATLYMVLLAAFELMLYHHSGQEDILVASPMVGRSRAEFEGLVGFFANPVVLRANLSGNPTFRAFLGQVRETVLAALEHQDFPTLRLVQRLRPPRDLSRSPLCQTMFVLDKPHRLIEQAESAFVHGETGLWMDLGGLVMESIPLERRAATLDLVMLIIETTGSLSASIRFNADLFDAATIARKAGHFHALLESVIRNPAAAIGDLEILTGAERQQLLVEFNNTQTDYPKDKCLHQLFEEQVQRTPDNVAVVFEGQQLTFAQLNARANQLAHHLQTLGVGPEVPVAICMERCPEMVVGLLGILKAGGAYVPLDPASPKERRSFMMEDAHTAVLLTQGHIVDPAPGHGIHAVYLDSGWEAIAAKSEKNPVTGVTAGNLAYILYTSGSTGQPKGVMVEHRGLCNAINWIIQTLELSAADRCLLKTPITFDAAGRELFPILLTGGRLVIAAADGHRDSRYLAETIRGARISIFHCVPSLLQFLVEEPAFDDSLTLRAVMCGGEALPIRVVERFQHRSKAKLYNVYGPTETIIDSTCCLCEGANHCSTSPIGRPIPNARIYILNHALHPLPIGVAGEMHIGGVGLARGYLNRPELTAEKFIPDPFSAEPGAQMYKTGDLARYLPDGNIEFLGRGDHQVKIRGVRIELGEIEAALGKHPAVRKAVVLAREDTPGEKRLVAYVLTESTADELRRFLKDKLPDQMVPAVFVLLDTLPLLSNGKIDQRALPAPDRTRPELEKTFVAPRTPTEELLAKIWAQVLDLERVGIHDNFFDLGGHSLLATQAVSRMRDAFEVDIPLRRLFEVPTVAGLAESIEAARQAGQNLLAPPILPVPRNGDPTLSFAQQRLWFFNQLDPGNSAYNIPAAVRLKGPFNLAALEQSLNEVVKRHESLRTTFGKVEGRPTQVIAPTLTIKLPIVDLRELPASERETEVRRLVTAEAQRSFDLSQGPLLRGTVLRLADEEHVGLLTMHHIVSDGWSTGILIREMATLYVAFCAGGSSPLPALPIQYADFAHWQRQWLQGEVLETQIAYWKEQLAGAPTLIDLPTDHPRPAMQTFRGAHQSLVLPRHLKDGYKVLSRQEGVTLFMILLAAFKVLLSRYTSQDDLIVGTPIANRNRQETEGLIGFFVNALVLRTDLSGDPSFREFLRRVREVCLGAYSHQDLPFDRLVEELHLERDLSRNPLFQVMFALQNTPLRALALPGLTLSPVEGDSETAHFDLTLQIVDTEQELTAALVYNTDLFEAGTIVRMLGNFQTLLEAILADPEQRLSDLQLLTTTERQQLLAFAESQSDSPQSGCSRTTEPAAGWGVRTTAQRSLVERNDTQIDHPKDKCLHKLFEEQVQRTPDAIAVVFEAGQLTYGELNRRANQLAHHLQTLGVGPDVLVGICVERSLEMIIGLLGILKAGGAFVPLDPAYPNERLAFMLKDSQVPVLLTQERLVAGLPESDARVICLDSGWETMARESGENTGRSTLLENLAYVIYTSGSTGQPKGVLVSHGSIAGHGRNAQRLYELDSRDVVLQFASLSFDVSLEEILPTLIVGARLVIMGTNVWPPVEFHRKISEFGLTVLNLPTAYWQELARAWADVPELVPNIPPRLFIVGGDTMLPEVLKLWQRTPMNSIRLLNAYGPTETTITATAFEIAPRPGENTTNQRVPIGRPLANRAIYILDQHGKPVPIGVAGHLHIGGAGLARGYLNRPELTAEKFIPDPFSAAPGARMYQTGDLARYRPDGNIEFLGRADHQVKIRGFRIELGEIEAALGRHPALREAVVVAREDAPGEKRLVAYVVADSTADELRHFLKDRLPEYMVPAVVVLLEALPVTPNGKVDRRALPAPDRSRPELGKAFVAPRDDLELQLAHIWEEILGVRPVGVRDNFFELGGHSLLAVRLFALIEKRLGKKLPLTAIFQGATVEHLAGVLHQQAMPGPQSSLVPLQPGGGKRPLFLVHPAGGHVFPYIHLAQLLGSDQPCYGLQARGLEDGQDPPTRIEDMAAWYIQALQTVQPTGPYMLGGWSMGGVVAFEMAQQLRAQGQQVALLALLDGRIPTPDETFPEEDAEAVLLVERYFGISFGPMESLAELPKDKQLAFMLEQAKSAGLIPAELDVAQARRFVELLRNDLRATQNYGLHRYPGRITFFKASEVPAGTSPDPDPTMGWSEWASGGVEVHVVPGNHANLMYAPHVEVLAEKLTACLNQAQSAEAEENGAAEKINLTTAATAFDSWIAFRKPNPKARLRLFCFPYAGIGASIFRTWSDGLPAEVEVCPVEFPGRGTRLMVTPFTKLPQLVRVLAQALVPLLDKPFAFFGHSLGALVGFELARQLRRQSGVQPVRLFVSADRAPQIPHRDRPIHALPEGEFLVELRRLNGIPGKVLEEAELMQMMLPVLRADFAIYETYAYATEPPLNCPISTFGGLQDQRVSRGDLEAWRTQTSGSFSLRMFPGDHFFWNTTQPLLLQALFQELREELVRTTP
jgi:amino acid adenylation domain-containing protein